MSPLQGAKCQWTSERSWGSLPIPFLSPGPFAVISVMIGSLTDSLLPSDNFLEFVNGTNVTTVNEEQRDAARVELVATITVLTGIFQVRGPQLSLAGNGRLWCPMAMGHSSFRLSFQVALGLLQFGFVVTYLSDPLVRGYTTAASVHVLVSQLKNVFGVSVGEYSGPLSMFKVRGCLLLPWDPPGTHLWGTEVPKNLPWKHLLSQSHFVLLCPLDLH